jgi:hypothetical protein
MDFGPAEERLIWKWALAQPQRTLPRIPLPLALIYLRNPRLALLTLALAVEVCRSRIAGRGSQIPGSDDEPGSRCTVHVRRRDTTHESQYLNRRTKG